MLGLINKVLDLIGDTIIVFNQSSRVILINYSTRYRYSMFYITDGCLTGGRDEVIYIPDST